VDVEDRRDVAVHSTISSRLNYMDFSEETTARFNAVAHAIMLSMGAEGPRRTADALYRSRALHGASGAVYS
jgi:hypothetical protein